MKLRGIGNVKDSDLKNIHSVINGKRILVTGHTGFKGAWLSVWLRMLGAEVQGLAFDPDDEQKILHDSLHLPDLIHSTIGDIRDVSVTREVINNFQPEIVMHLAAQSLVGISYSEPVDTFSTNVMGTINILESCRGIKSIKGIVVVTSDKCYQNNEWAWGYRENDALGGNDPYSASKACAELVTHAYRYSFFSDKDSHTIVASARAGNVIGGGDWTKGRIVPDIIQSIINKQSLTLRFPTAVRPWQHVLEPLYGYIVLASKMILGEANIEREWNFGPSPESEVSVRELVELVCRTWQVKDFSVVEQSGLYHEASVLRLDCNRARTELFWKPRLTLEETVSLTVDWYKKFTNESCSVLEVCEEQIRNYMLLIDG
jgi:CDP-glucose 4,6-dehydratase